MKKITMIAACIVSVFGIAACSSNQQPQVITITETAVPQETTNIYQDSLNQVWNQFSSSDKEDMCLVFNTNPEIAWQAFDEGASGAVPKSEFYKFFIDACSIY